ncbi:CPBP family intramembrane glutamic endopeptidase [Urechidicola vernalis]|uniref:CPBP family intramembrane glutamic endopeptidase n=1 Tax=Urechidicola vernalis TaxID=3075600 RepID=A0ABU2Y0N3_9FLAO|nr:CPBP family intramembrane glutamic endopeptidase [Urechidicola sp. P050]MDT0551724.1 CPBP family intramembrane glutamic endopeptidase [Urechidicola sp. P050]
MKTKLFNYLNKPYAVVFIMLIAPLFGFMDRNFVFFFGLGVVFLLLKGSKYDWSKFGIGEKITKKTITKSILIALVLFLVFTVIIDPLLQNLLGTYDLSSIDDIRGNLSGYVILMLVMWVFAAFGEEILFRGYYMKGLAELFGNSNKAWMYSAVITSLYFGISHAYQGFIGVVSVFLWSLLISLLFNKNRNNLLLLVLIHGIYDSIGITLIYLNKDTVITDWLLQLL